MFIRSKRKKKTVTISNPFKFNDTPNSDGLYSVELQDELKGKDKEKEITKYLQGLYNDKPGLFIHYTEWEWESAVDSDMSHTFNNLPYGYYFIKCGNGAVVSITSTTPSANIIDKNQKGPGVFTKKIIPNDKLNAEVSEAEKKEVDTANYTDTVTYEVVVDTTNYDGAKSIANYYIQDTLQKGLSYVTVTNENNKKVVTPIEIYVNSVAPTNKITYTGGEVVEDSDTEPLLLQDGTRLEGGSRFNITIPWSTFNKETNEATFLTNANSSDKLIIRYQVKVNDKATIAENGNKNYATYQHDTWDPENPDKPKNPDPEKWKEEKETTVYTYALAIKKTDAEGKSLAGATFTVTNGDGVNVQLKETVAGSGIYEYVSANVDENATEVVSPASGQIIIKGIKGFAENDSKEYTLTEVKAPNGYNLLTSPVKLKPIIATKYSTKYTIEYKKDADGKVTVTTTKFETDANDPDKAPDFNAEVAVILAGVINNAGALLPSTGGIGTTIFYAAGIILMAGAVFFVVRRKRA